MERLILLLSLTVDIYIALVPTDAGNLASSCASMRSEEEIPSKILFCQRFPT